MRLPLIPGEVFTEAGEIELNVGRKTKTIAGCKRNKK